MTSNQAGISAVLYADADTIWDYHRMRHRLRRSAAAIGLGSHDLGVAVYAALLISKPYMERRAFATCRKAWPEVEVTCASEPLSFSEYVTEIGSTKLVIDMLVGDFQRIVEYPARGYSIAQDVPACVDAAYQRLLAAGYDSRLLGR